MFICYNNNSWNWSRDDAEVPERDSCGVLLAGATCQREGEREREIDRIWWIFVALLLLL